MRGNIGTAKPYTFDGLSKLWNRSEGLNLYVADTASTELQCQLGCRILQGATLLQCRQESTLAHALRESSFSEDACDRALGVSPGQDVQAVPVPTEMASATVQSRIDTGTSYECSEEFWDVDLDPDLPQRKPGAPRFPMPEPTPVFQCQPEEKCHNPEVADTDRPPRKNRDFVFTEGNPKKVFVGNLNFKTGQRTLWNFFKKFGPVEYCHLQRDRIKRRSKGRGFVIFESEETVQKILEASPEELVLDEWELKVERARKKQYLPEVPDDSPEDATELQNDEEMHSPTDPPEEDQSIEGQGKMNIKTLNDDIMLHVFSYLTLQERLQAERVCGRWRHLSHLHWQSMDDLDFASCIRRFGVLTEKLLKRLLRRGSTQLRRLDISASPRRLADGAMEGIAQHCPNLTHINLSGASLSNVGLRKLAEGCARLQWVSLRHCYEVGEDGVWWLFHRCKDLKCVDLNGNGRVKGPCFHVLTGNVDKLLLNDCTKLKDVALEKLAQMCQNLRHLELDRCVTLSDAGIASLTSGCQALQVLRLTANSQMTSAGFGSIGRLHGLEVLYLANNLGVNDYVLEAIGRGCGRLRVLDITNCHQGVTDVGIQALTACTRLQELHMSYLHQVGELGLTALAHNASLVKLVARGCSHVTESAIEALVELCYDLEELDVSGCVQLGNTALGHIIACRLQQNGTTLALHLGGTSMDPEDLEVPSSLCIHQNDLCMYHLVPDRDIALAYFGDSEEEDGDEFGDLGGADDNEYLDNDDPLEAERWEMS